ncbi:phosphoenolpyruvate--protein phosphotransferase [Heliobacterium gestii]|uniref:Phosphoenolpyruvate-protein phosphotransferase n=1 Tax=Heliomicrobium gestii TaxID=2699 RepID=A0A845LEA1_HELGE|nr:phosphoenolpyruvate--protein phosphotransferase [Heliomicrobium gestii]MBM7866245.1 phosphotransferase system enzyme I (PtsI) [Heliomicrobium gestii]MZP42959.1 phosphoenolpyruvate--protein phosphotransferase [Heliomicrobium gestii]
MTTLIGRGVVTGVALGRIKRPAQDLTAWLDRYVPGTVDEEAARLERALAGAKGQLLAIRSGPAVDDTLAAIMDAHLLMLDDPGLIEGIGEKIREGIGAPPAVIEACEAYAGLFASLDDPYLRERAADVRDIGRRVAGLLLGVDRENVEPPETPDDGAQDAQNVQDSHGAASAVVLCAPDIEPSVVAAYPPGRLQALLLGQGSTTSHAVIIAKARGIVTVVGLGDALEQIPDGAEVIVDGATGEVSLSPPAPERHAALARIAEQAERRQRDLAEAALPAVTRDGVTVQLAANIGVPGEVENARALGAEGVGLFRSEFLFMGRDTFPSEEEQFLAYRQAAEGCGGHICVIRTLDIGGDKPLPHLAIAKEHNPFLGWRAIRISLERTELFRTQVKAILRAGCHGKVAIMLPMVISAGEIRQARALVAEAATELTAEGRPFAAHVPVGIMIETPAAAATAHLLAPACDFFSIGTNDLVQYTLAVDRGNAKVASLYSHFHPAVLRLIDATIQAARRQGIWVGMCGEMAGDPLATPLLVGMGIDELSMSAPSIPRVKAVIRRLSTAEARSLRDAALALDDAAAIRAYLEEMRTPPSA